MPGRAAVCRPAQLLFPAFRRAFLERGGIKKNTKSIKTQLPAFVSCSQKTFWNGPKAMAVIADVKGSEFILTPQHGRE